MAPTRRQRAVVLSSSPVLHPEFAPETKRPELFKRTETRLPIRVHDLRATFVTISLANGKSEAWIADRTGHKSSSMINKYRRKARQAKELGLGELTPLDQAIPELRRKGGPQRSGRDTSVRKKKSQNAPQVSKEYDMTNIIC